MTSPINTPFEWPNLHQIQRDALDRIADPNATEEARNRDEKAARALNKQIIDHDTTAAGRRATNAPAELMAAWEKTMPPIRRPSGNPPKDVA